MSVVGVFIVDDSALMREVLTEVFQKASGIQVVGTARDAEKALPLIIQLRPSVVTLDVEMPGASGLTLLERLMREFPVPVVMVSSLTKQGSSNAMRALSLGAVDVIAKPTLDLRTGTLAMAEELVLKVRAAARAKLAAARDDARMRMSSRADQAFTQDAKALLRPSASQGAERYLRPATGVRPVVRVAHSKILALGASTGGTEALFMLLTRLPADAPATVIVQHMPEHFTQSFALRLDKACAMRVKEAQDGDTVQPGLALLAPGGRHMRMLRAGPKFVVRISDDPPVGLHRPSVDVLFESCARAAGAAAVGVILTGMGADGAYGLLEMRKVGAFTIAQDEASCVVFGMPKEAIARGAAVQILPLRRISDAILKATA